MREKIIKDNRKIKAVDWYNNGTACPDLPELVDRNEPCKEPTNLHMNECLRRKRENVR